MKPHNHPFEEVCATAQEQIALGHQVFQKFTCDKCGVRQMIEEANHFYTSGRCAECGHITDIRAAGCNYLLAISLRG